MAVMLWTVEGVHPHTLLGFNLMFYKPPGGCQLDCEGDSLGL